MCLGEQHVENKITVYYKTHRELSAVGMAAGSRGIVHVVVRFDMINTVFFIIVVNVILQSHVIVI